MNLLMNYLNFLILGRLFLYSIFDIRSYWKVPETNSCLEKAIDLRGSMIMAIKFKLYYGWDGAGAES